MIANNVLYIQKRAVWICHEEAYPHFFVDFFHSSSTLSTIPHFWHQQPLLLIFKHLAIIGTFWHSDCDIR